MVIQKILPMKPIAKGILIGILGLLAIGAAFVFVAPMAMEQIAFSEQKRIFDNSAGCPGISDSGRRVVGVNNNMVTPEILDVYKKILSECLSIGVRK